MEESRREEERDPQDPEQRHHQEPPELKSEDIPGRSFAGTSYAADEEEQTEDIREAQREHLPVTDAFASDTELDPRARDSTE